MGTINITAKVTFNLSDFSQGMILPTADGQKPSTPVASKKNQVKAAKTQVQSTCCPDPADSDWT